MHDSSLADFSELDKEIEGVESVRATARSQATWQKVVETPSRPPASHPPRPPRPPQSLHVLRNVPYGSPFRSVVFFWISLLLLLLAVSAGLFGLAVTFGRGPAFVQHGLSLSASPDIAPVGTKVSLHGLGFTPGGQVGFFRDGDIQLANVRNVVTMLADDQGDIANTVQISADWGGGEHMVMAEDASTHKIASFPIQIMGNMGPLRPAHLHLSTTSLDLGTGDQATNTLQTVALDNSGSGQIAWQGTTTQPWLMMSPRSGTLSAGQPAQITIAVNRYNLTPGDHKADLFFSSYAGNTTLNISMHVSHFVMGNDGVLQLTPAVLAFDATDAGNNPDPQVVTVSNPGHASLNWHAKSSVAWLTLSQHAGDISPAHSSAIAISVHTATLLPGVYSGDITFSAEGSALHSPQHVYVSITVSPQCSVQVSPGMLSFNGTLQQGPPAVQTVGLTSSQSCTSPAHWSAHSTANWVTLSVAGGTAPGSLNVGVNPAGLGAGPHSASVVFTSAAGSQVVPINFNLGSVSAPELALGASALGFQGVLNGGNPVGQLLRVSNTGRGQLSWRASVQTNSGGNWLSLNATSGRLTPGQSISLAVNAAILASFVPDAYTYTGVVSVVGTDSTGHLVSGGPLNVPVNFKVSAACSVAVSSNVQTFSVLAGSATPATGAVNVTASNTCQHLISLNAVASTMSGGNWLSTQLSSKTLTPSTSAVITMNTASAVLTHGTYYGLITVTATDTVTHALMGVPQRIDVTLNVQPPCTLQAPSNGVLTFNEQPGAVTDAQTFTIGVVGTCNSGPVTIVPTALMQGTPWFTITPTTLTTQAGTSTAFTVTVNMAQLTAPSYQGSISIAALEGGIAIVGSQQSVIVGLTIASAPALSVSPVDGVHFDLSSGDSSAQTVNVSNVGGGSLDWGAHLRGDAPAFLSLSTGVVLRLPGGSSTSFNLTVNTTGITAGTYPTAVLIDAQDSTTTKTLGGELSIPVTIQVTSTPVPIVSPAITPEPTIEVASPTVPVTPVISSVIAATPTVPPVTASATTVVAAQPMTTVPALTPARTAVAPTPTVPPTSHHPPHLTNTLAAHKKRP